MFNTQNPCLKGPSFPLLVCKRVWVFVIFDLLFWSVMALTYTVRLDGKRCRYKHIMIGMISPKSCSEEVCNTKSAWTNLSLSTINKAVLRACALYAASCSGISAGGLKWFPCVQCLLGKDGRMSISVDTRL